MCGVPLVDGEYLALGNAHGEVGDGVGGTVTEAGIVWIGLRREQSEDVLEASYLELFRISSDNFSVH